MKYFFARLAVTAALIVVCMSDFAHAQEITQNQALNFGTFAIADNNTVSSLVVTPDNDVFADPAFVVGVPAGQRGYYTLTGLPPNVSFFLGVQVPNPPSEGGIVLDDSTPASAGGGPVFTLEDITIANGGVLQSDAQGDAVLYIGGSLKTSGNGQRYTGGNYFGTYQLTIYY